MEEEPVVMFMLSMYEELSYYVRGFFVTLYTDQEMSINFLNEFSKAKTFFELYCTVVITS